VTQLAVITPCFMSVDVLSGDTIASPRVHWQQR